MRFCFLLLLLLSLECLSQEKIRFSKEILSVKKSNDERRLAVTTADSVYILDAGRLFTLRKWKHGVSFPIVLGFHPANNNLLLLQQNNLTSFLPGVSDYRRVRQYLSSEKGWQEFPGDSVYIWNIDSTKKLYASPGNVYLAFGGGSNELAVFYNRVGRSGYLADSSEIQTKRGDQIKKSAWTKACRRILLDGRSSAVAVSWYAPSAKSGSSFGISVLDFLTHAPTLEVAELSELPADFAFSSSGRWFAISGAFGKERKLTTRIYDLVDKQLRWEIPSGGHSLQFSSGEKTLEFLDESGVWSEWDISSQQKTKTIWSNLTGLFALENAVPLPTSLIFSGTAWSGFPFSSTAFYQLESVGRKDLDLFSTIDQPRSEALTDTTQFALLLNDVTADNNRPVIRFSSDRSWLTAVTQNQLQVWNIDQRKKIFQRPFQASIKAFPDRSGTAFLVLEQKGQMSFSEYRMHRISLSENSLYTSGIYSGVDSMLRGGVNCDCLPDPEKDNAWRCADGTNTIWQVEGNELRLNARFRFTDRRILSHQIDAQGDHWFKVSDEKEERSYWKWSRGNAQPEFVRKAGEENWSAGAGGLWTWKKDKDNLLEYWEKDLRVRVDTIPGPVQRVDPFPGQVLMLVQYEKEGRDCWQVLSPSQPTTTHPASWIGAELYPLKEKLVLVENEGFATVAETEKNILPWSISSPKILSTTNFSVSENGRFLLLGNSVLDLKEIAQTKIDKYQAAELLQDTGRLEWVELVEDRNWGTSKSRFRLMRINNNGMDTSWGKTWFTPEMDGMSYYTQSLTVSPDQQWVVANWERILSSGTTPAPILWNTRTLEGFTLSAGKGTRAAFFSKDGTSLIVRTSSLMPDRMKEKEQLQFYSLVPFRKVRTIERVVPIGSASVAHAEQYVINSRNVAWYKTINDSAHLQKNFYSRDYLQGALYHAGSDQILAGTKQGAVHLWDRGGSLSPTKTIQLHAAAVARLEIRDDRLFSLGEDGSVAILDIPSRKLLAKILTVRQEGEISMVIYTPEGYYRADAGLTPLTHFVNQGKIYPLSSFEYQGNRPDKVYAALGLADSNFIALLKNSWEARLKRAGVPMNDKPKINAYPVVRWVRRGQDVFTADSLFRLSVTVQDPSATQCRLFIRVNGVPIGTRKGDSVLLVKQRALIERSIVLSEGKNRISVLATNESGEESVEQEFELIYQPKQKRPTRIFYAGVGVSSYADSNYNLRYAAKDVEDIAKELEQQFDGVSLLRLTNERATRKNILQLHDWLKEAGTDDVVILSLSGHGMVDSEKGFIYAPHDMDFSRPGIRGVAMEELESILDDIPARKRLLLIDACHSGEAWADTTQSASLPPGVSVTPRGFEVEAPVESAGTQKQAFFLMKELFSDLTRGNGAFVISAAGSNEFAFEGNRWKNGVFTLSLLESIRELKWRDNFSGSSPIPIRSLRKKIYEKVKRLTRGQQNPTSRQENGWWDWSF